MGSNGLVPAWCPFSDKEKIIYRGIALEVFDKLKSRMRFVPQESVDWVAISSEKLKRIYDGLVAGSGTEIWFGSFVCDALRKDNRIEEIIVANKSGLTALSAKIYIDATGDGDLAAFAGAEFEKGDENGHLQASTLCFKMANINTDDFDPSMLFPESEKSPIYRILQSGRYPDIIDEHLCCYVVDEGVLGFNATHILNIDYSNVAKYSNGMMLGRKIAEEYREALAEFMPNIFRDACIVSTGSVMGTRESRRIKGDYVLTADDYFARKTFEDEIARNCYYLDLHATAKRTAVNIEDRKQYTANCGQYGAGESHGIPFRCLIPKGFDNMLTAGRIISCDRQVFGSIRVMPNCLTTGQAAGTAAAMAALENMGVHNVDIVKLRTKLKNDGAYFK